MNEKTRIKIIALALLLSIIWAGSNYLSDKKNETTIDTPQTIAKLEPNAQQVQMILPDEVLKRTKKTAWGDNPFFSQYFGIAEFSPETPDDEIVWILSGIFYNTKTPTAIINKRPVKVGQKVNNAEVVQINKDEVTIKIDNQELKLTISKG